MARIAIFLVPACLIALPAYAQHEHQSPYAGMEASEIPSLTPQELEGLRSGAGMGFAKPAELNHYPGPKHVLELADKLQLTDEQRSKVEAIFSEMNLHATELGEAIIDAERVLSRRFKNQHVDDVVLAEATGEIAELYGELRYTHLRAHLATRAVLDDAQIAEYDHLRGYGAEQ